jgi:hypothetical protein
MQALAPPTGHLEKQGSFFKRNAIEEVLDTKRSPIALPERSNTTLSVRDRLVKDRCLKAPAPLKLGDP